MRFSLLAGGLLASVAMVTFACGGSDDSSPGTSPATPASRSFDTSTLDRSCSVDTDCAFVDTIDDCYSCCANTTDPVRNTPAVQASVAEVAKTCGGRKVCGAVCTPKAACANGTCTRVAPASDAGTDGG
jgi:hypothetical protein